jgi:hypothetical protein
MRMVELPERAQELRTRMVELPERAQELGMRMVAHCRLGPPCLWKQRYTERETSAEKRREGDISREAPRETHKQRTCVCAWRERLIGVPSNLAEHNKYLILVERITWSPRACMQVHNHDRQLVSLCEIQQCHVRSKNVMQLVRQTETPALDLVGFLYFTCCTRFFRERVCMRGIP